MQRSRSREAPQLEVGGEHNKKSERQTPNGLAGFEALFETHQ
jgi:hypothetical protein